MGSSNFIQHLLIGTAAIFWLWLGIMAFARTKHLLRGFGIETSVADSWNEVRAVYGGFPLAMAAILIVSLFAPVLTDGIAVCVGSAMLGMCLGRLVSGILDRTLGRMPQIFAAIEFVVAMILILPVLIKFH
jgi:hypothetical protein